MSLTKLQYASTITACKRVFLSKMRDYGMSWNIFRKKSMTDQIFIKACRIRTLQETGENNVGESIWSEFCGIVNYCVIYMLISEMPIQTAISSKGKTTFECTLHDSEGKGETRLITIDRLDFDADSMGVVYDSFAKHAEKIMEAKNADYGEIWRELRIESITDIILSKLLRIKKIEDNAGLTLVSEGIESNIIDILNYAAFCIIKIEEDSENRSQIAPEMD